MLYRELLKDFNYYAAPEGQAPFQKIGALTKYATVTGLLVGVHDTILISRTKTVLDTARCLGFWIVPLCGMGAAFASATYIATNLRKKDDTWNYVIGAIASGGVLHAWSKSGLTTLYGTIFLSIFAAVKKNSVENGWTFFPQKAIETEYFGPIIQTESAKRKTYERDWVKA